MQFVVWMECTDGEDGGVSVLIEFVMVVTDMILGQNFTPPDFQAKNFTP